MAMTSTNSQRGSRPTGDKPTNGVVAVVQMTGEAAKDRNVEKALSRIAEAAAAGANVVCLQELFAGQYPCQSEDHRRFDQAEPIPGPTSERLAETARRHGVVVIGSLFERRAAGLYHNTAVVIGQDGKIIDSYRKMHIPDDPSYHEKYYFSPGDLGFKSTNTPFGKIGVLICWDQWYPEAARITALKGANVIFYPTAIGWHPAEKEKHGAAQLDAWRTIQRGHAIANGVFVAAVNRTGREVSEPGAPGLEFWGSSFVSDPFGVVLASASVEREQVLVQEIDLGLVEETRRNWPFLRDRRIDAFADITKRFSEE